MRVAIDARLVAYQRAGIATYVSELLEALPGVAPDLHITVLASRKDPDPLIPDGAAGLRLWTPPHHRFEQAGLALELSRLAVDVYHAPDFIPPFVRRFPAVVTIHDLWFVRDPSVLTAEGRRYYGQVGRATREASRIIAVSECTRRDLVDLLGAQASRVTVVHEAADPAFRPRTDAEVADVKSQFGLPDEFILFVGTREPRKNLARLIDAYAIVASDPDYPTLIIAGSRGWLGDDLLERARRLGVDERVRLIGRVERDCLPALYSAALAFVFPTLYEGFGLPVLEAMACGTPVIATSAGAVPEVAGDAALLIDPLDPSGIAVALRRIWREPGLREEQRGRGLERSRCFSWRRAAEETAEVYRLAAA